MAAKMQDRSADVRARLLEVLDLLDEQGNHVAGAYVGLAIAHLDGRDGRDGRGAPLAKPAPPAS